MNSNWTLLLFPTLLQICHHEPTDINKNVVQEKDSSIASASSSSFYLQHHEEEMKGGNGLQPIPSQTANLSRSVGTTTPSHSNPTSKDTSTDTPSQSAGADNTSSQFSFTAWQSPNVTASSYITSTGLSGLG